MTKLHLYTEIEGNETLEQATARTNSALVTLFGQYGFTVLEQEQNEDIENEIKSFLSVDIQPEQAHSLLSKMAYQIY